ncbi:hypothetical protein [Amylibacter sp. SFDW26]|uniref:hypothetical protein n=1 Tax=Amylibacter sp. SFDW26 TaxID=2652722 RepID=UPI001869D985|nr:hypothetical protein [Amylibacter sp. SFDW26]
MLISLALLAVISVGLASSLDFGRQVWLRADTYSNIETTVMLRNIVKEWVEEIEDSSNVTGTSETMDFVIYPKIVPNPKVTQLKISLFKSNISLGDALMFSARGYDLDGNTVFQDQRALKDGLIDINIQYYGNTHPNTSKEWHSAWDHKQGTLDLIKVTAQTNSGAVFIPFTARVGKTARYKKISASSLVPPD